MNPLPDPGPPPDLDRLASALLDGVEARPPGEPPPDDLTLRRRLSDFEALRRSLASPEREDRHSRTAAIEAAVDRWSTHLPGDRSGESAPMIARLPRRWAAAAAIALLTLGAGVTWLARDGGNQGPVPTPEVAARDRESPSTPSFPTPPAEADSSSGRGDGTAAAPSAVADGAPPPGPGVGAPGALSSSAAGLDDLSRTASDPPSIHSPATLLWCVLRSGAPLRCLAAGVTRRGGPGAAGLISGG